MLSYTKFILKNYTVKKKKSWSWEELEVYLT